MSGWSFHLDRHGARASSRSINRSMMSAWKSSGVASLTLVRRRREIRLLSLGTLIITHVNESVGSRARLLQTCVYVVAKATVPQRDGPSRTRNARRSHRSGTTMRRDWLSRLLSVTRMLISVALINQLTLISLYDSLTAQFVDRLRVFQGSRSIHGKNDFLQVSTNLVKIYM